MAVLGQEAAPPAPAPPVAAPAPAANPVPATPAPGAGNHPRGLGSDPMMMFRLARQMDANGNLLVEEKELSDGISKFATDAKVLCADLLKWLDTDKDGTLSLDEWRPFNNAMWQLPVLRSVDQNNDLAVQDEELDAAFSRMAEFCQSSNARTLQQFDRDHDGKLSEEELQAARKAMQRFTMRGPGGGAPGAAGGTAPAAGNGPVPVGEATPGKAP